MSKYPMTSNAGHRAVRTDVNHSAGAGSWRLPVVLYINCLILWRSGDPEGGAAVEENH